MTNEQKHEIAKLFWDIPYCEVVVADDFKRPREWEYSLPAGTLCVLYKLSDDDVDYDTVCHLLMEDPKDKRIRELEAELAAFRSKEPLYDPVDVKFDEIFGNPRRFRFGRSLGDAVMDGPDIPAGPEVTCSEDDGNPFGVSSLNDVMSDVRARYGDKNALMPNVPPVTMTPEIAAELAKPTKTSQEWLRDPEFANVRVLDPDGWDRENFKYSFDIECITRDEFRRRLRRSTVRLREEDDGA